MFDSGNWMKWQSIILLLCISVFISCRNQSGSSGGKNHPMESKIEDFHLLSYYAGSISTTAEFVGTGCKKVGISPVFTEEQFSQLQQTIETEAGKHNVPILIERNLLITTLFPEDVAKDGVVVLFAHSQSYLDEYQGLKSDRVEAVKNGTSGDLERELAWKFGKLLSYTDEKIEALIASNIK